MRPHDRDLLLGIRATLTELVLPETKTPLVQARLGIVLGMLESVAEGWDTRVQCLLETHAFVADQFRRAVTLLESLPEPSPELPSLLEELRSAANDVTPPDFRMTTLIEWNNAQNALLIRLMELCDRALDEPSLAVLLPLRDDLLAHVLREAELRCAGTTLLGRRSG